MVMPVWSILIAHLNTLSPPALFTQQNTLNISISLKTNDCTLFAPRISRLRKVSILFASENPGSIY